MAVRYKMKMKYKIVFSVIIVVILGTILYSFITYRMSNEYKFKEIGYSEAETEFLLKFDNSFQNKLIKLGKDEDLLEILKQKYFIPKNLDKYLEYKKKNRTNEEITLEEIIAKVNIHRDKYFYENTFKTDTSKGNLILVNKYYYLDKTFLPKGVKNADLNYSYDGIKVATESYNAFIKMFNAAKSDGIKLILNSGYRSYDYQEKLYKEYADNYGEEYADEYAARAGFSEHQTGLSYDIVSPGVTGEDFDKTNAFKWLSKNAHKYGFILRYPKGKEDYTGFKYESWHYRYIGEEMATKVKNSGLTYDEFYAYYIEYKKQ